MDCQYIYYDPDFGIKEFYIDFLFIYDYLPIQLISILICVPMSLNSYQLLILDVN